MMSELRRSEVPRESYEHLFMIRAHLNSLQASAIVYRPVGQETHGLVMLRRCALDIRMIVEELMLLSVSAHLEKGAEISKALRSSYSADKKMRMMEEINPKFFPEAIDIVPSDEEGIAGRFTEVTDAYLTRDYAKATYHWCDRFLHASHKALSNEEFHEAIERAAGFHALTERLLRTFEVDLSGSGFMVCGNLNYGSDEAPQLFEARVGAQGTA